MEQAIDAVIAWVDGNDPAHRAKRQRYSAQPEVSLEDIGGETRFVSTGEIYFCVASIARFAPFVRKIFIVTDQQDPRAGEFLQRNFPGTSIGVEVVDHKVLFLDYERYLPTFNSLSIETVLWRIPGLSERFVYFNDDFFLMDALRPEDWFASDGSLVCHGDWFNTAFARFLRAVKPARNGHKPFGFKDALLNAADLLHQRRFFNIGHAPRPQLKSLLQTYFTQNPDVMERNMACRFRDADQFNTQELCALLAYRQGCCQRRSLKGRTLFLKPSAAKADYLRRHIQKVSGNSMIRFGCINSLEKADAEDRQAFETWICHLLGICPDFSKWLASLSCACSRHESNE